MVFLPYKVKEHKEVLTVNVVKEKELLGVDKVTVPILLETSSTNPKLFSGDDGTAVLFRKKDRRILLEES